MLSGSNGASLAAIAAALEARKSGNSYVAKCPCHPDKTPSLRLCEKQGKVLVHCFAGCAQSDLLRTLADMGLWPRQSVSPYERDMQRQAWVRQQRDARAKLIEIGNWLDTLDRLKLRALDLNDEAGYRAACHLQFEAQCEWDAARNLLTPAWRRAQEIHHHSRAKAAGAGA